MAWSSRRPARSESRWASGAWASGQNSFSQCVKSLEIPDESLMKAGIYSKVEARTLGHIPHSGPLSSQYILLPAIFSSLRKRVLMELLHLSFHIVILVLILPFHDFSTIFWPNVSWPHYILILFSFSNRQWLFKIFLSNTTLSISLLYTVSPTECQYLKHTHMDLGGCLHFIFLMPF